MQQAISKCILLLLFALIVHAYNKVFLQKNKLYSKFTALYARKAPYFTNDLRGKIVITGINETEEDEFLLGLLNSQTTESEPTWQSVVIPSTNAQVTRKIFLSRNARYSGLLDVLDIVQADISQPDELARILQGATAWLAIQVPKESIPSYTDAALAAGVNRTIFTTELLDEEYRSTELPEFTEAIAKFSEAGGRFTGIRHPEIIPGDENNPYEIVNATTPLVFDTVEKGVLYRVVAELLHIRTAANVECGVSTGGVVHNSYLSMLRNTGLTRRDEVYKLFSGGFQRIMGQIEGEASQVRALKEEKRIKKLEQKKLQKELEETQLAKQNETIRFREFDIWKDSLSMEERIQIRSEKILQQEYDRLSNRRINTFTRFPEFKELNKHRALFLAKKELEEEKAQRELELLKKKTLEVSRDSSEVLLMLQYKRLIALELEESVREKEEALVWCQFIDYLIEYTIAIAEDSDILFYNLDEYQQTDLLLKVSNILRVSYGIIPHDIIYDYDDAKSIIDQFDEAYPEIKEKIQADAHGYAKSVLKRHSKLLSRIPALRGATDRIQLAIQTLKRDVPEEPPGVDEFISAKQKLVMQKNKLIQEKEAEVRKRVKKPLSSPVQEDD